MNSLRLILTVAVSVVALLSIDPVREAVAEVEPSASVVAAGFGYQSGGTSTILIKTYHSQTGEVLSQESYDLAVHEETTAASSQSHERIFAGGAGMESAGLSKFVLRVYDAATGKFLWEGELNLTSHREEEAAQPVATLTQSRAVARRTAQPAETLVEPFFLIRALDLTTGGMLWQDQFASTGHGRARAERTIDGLAQASESEPRHAWEFEFVVSAFDRKNGALLWEDEFEPVEPHEEGTREEEDHATVLPMWHGLNGGAVESQIRWRDSHNIEGEERARGCVVRNVGPLRIKTCRI